MKKIFTIAAIITVLINNTPAYAQSSMKLVKTFPIASGGGWDYLIVGSDNKLYVSHGTQVNIVDKITGDSLGVIPNTTGVHGIAFDEAAGKGYTSNGKLNNVFVFDLKTGAVTSQIATGQNPDAILYEPFTKTIITCNGRSNDLSIIDIVSQKVIATIPVGGKPETAVSDQAGKLFVNIEDKNEIVSINLKTKQVDQRWSILPGESPTGLEYDKITKRLFAGCQKKLIVLDATNGKVVTQIPIGEGCDGVVFDNATKTIYTSNGADGSVTAIKEEDANTFKVVETIPTKKGARTIAIDETTHTLYLPTAAFESNTPKGQLPKPLPGTFQILVVK